MNDSPSVVAFEAALVAEEAARWTTDPAPEPKAEPKAETKPESKPEPKAEPATPEPSEAAPAPSGLEAAPSAEPEPEAVPGPTEDDEIAERIKRGHIEAREAKRHAKLLEQELAVLRGQRTESRDETIQREAEQLAQRIASGKQFNDECNRIAEAGRKQYADFDASIAALWEPLGGTNIGLLEAAVEAGSAHLTLRYLGKNPDEAERIANLSPARQGAALATLATKLATPKPKPVSKAPPPIQAISGGTTGGETVEIDLDKMSMAQLDKHWTQQERKRRAARFE